jgi:hypothetical protein
MIFLSHGGGKMGLKKSRAKLLVAPVFLLGFLFTAFTADQWKGKIEKEDGMTVIRNPKEPLYGELVLELEQDLSIGREDDENYAFYKSITCALDRQENIYVLDFDQCRIQQYDRDGKYVKTIGRKGQGPGEIESPVQIFIDSQDNIYIFQERQFKVFRTDGGFVKSIALRSFLSDFFITRQGAFFALFFQIDEKTRANAVAEFDAEGNLVKTLASYPDEGFVTTPRKAGENVVSFFFSHEYNNRIDFCPVGPESFCYGYSSEYKIFVVDAKGNAKFIIKKDDDPQPISGKEKGAIIDRHAKSRRAIIGQISRSEIERGIFFPKHKPFFNQFIADDKERIYVKRPTSSALDKEPPKEYTFDVFSREGRCLYRTKMPFIPRIIRNGHLYQIKMDEEAGLTKILRYKISNWTELKEE